MPEEARAIPKITILVPIYNGSKFIGATLSSIHKQSFQDFQVFCLDDCSTDGSREIVAQFVEEDPRFKLIVSASNRGSVPPVINAALERVESEFVVYSSQDDQFSTNWLQSMIDREAETGADAILPDVIFVGKSEGDINEIIGFRGDRSVILSNREAVVASLDWTIHGFAMWRASIVKKHGYAEFSAYADEFSTRQFYFECNRVAFSKGIFYSTQDNPEAITKKPSYRMFDAPRTALAVHDLLCREDFSLNDRSVQFLRSVNLFLGMCKTAFTDADKFPPSDFERSSAALRGFFGSLPPQRMRSLLRIYRPHYRTRSFVKLVLFALGNPLIERATVAHLRRVADRKAALAK